MYGDQKRVSDAFLDEFFLLCDKVARKRLIDHTLFHASMLATATLHIIVRMK